MISSTYQVCLKAEKLNETESEAIALCQRSTYEFRKALFSGNFTDACKFSSLLIRNLKPGPQRSLYILMNNILRLWS
jgi:hypothetical protein